MADNPLPFGKQEGSEKHSSHGKHDEPLAQNINELSNQFTNVSRRLRLLEERYETMRSKQQLSDQELLDFQKDIKRELKIGRDEISDFHKDLTDLKEKMRLIVKELKDCAKSDEVEVLKRYLQMWEPINFVTHNEIDRIVEEKIEERMRR